MVIRWAMKRRNIVVANRTIGAIWVEIKEINSEVMKGEIPVLMLTMYRMPMITKKAHSMMNRKENATSE